MTPSSTIASTKGARVSERERGRPGEPPEQEHAVRLLRGHDQPQEPKGRFAPWDDGKKFAYDPKTPYFELLVPNVDTTRFSFLLERCLEVDKSMLLPGTKGKSVIIVDYLAKHAEEKDLVPVVINFSAQTSATRHAAPDRVEAGETQDQVRRAPEQKDRALRGRRQYARARDVRRAASRRAPEAVPDLRGFYDRKKLFWKDVEDTTLICGCATRGGGRR